MSAHRTVPDSRRAAARTLRREATDAERLLSSRLRANRTGGTWTIRRQVPIAPFIVDFACHSARLVVEVDGATHATDAELARDAQRDAFLGVRGYDVARVTNDEVFHNLDGVVETIWRKLVERAPHLAAPEPDAKR